VESKNILSKCIGWGLALFLSGILNIFLFGIMPGLIQQKPQRPDDLEEIRPIQVVRIKHIESVPRKKETPKPREPEKKKLEKNQMALAPRTTPLASPPRLAFELNARLPQSTLNLPPMDRFSMTAPAFAGVFLASELDSPLTPLAKVPPIYPLRASRRGIQGWVKVQFVVNTEGGVENPEILEAVPDQIFDASVINCVAQWKFKPGTMEGVAVATLAQTTIKFQLE